MKRNAAAEWKGGLKDGKGTISTDSGVLAESQYSFSTRFEDGNGTNPEELIAAAHAGCFSMALSGQLGQAGLTAESIRTTASVKLEKTDSSFAITSVHLEVKARVPGADQQAFATAANNAKAGCPVSKVLKAEITMNASLET
ncbi:MAG TPA: OsmC family protein [Pyrinomonadaceae bacterium]|nr:OsmC family protein [Pyrinomonadaceae bacterium]